MTRLVFAFVLTMAATCRRGDTTVTDGDALTGDNTVQVDENAGDGSADAVEVPEHVAQVMENFNKVFFDFDKAELSPESKAALDANVGILQKHPDIKVQIQGHADERGSTEYNLALGDRRANTVKDYLAGQGVAPSRIAVVTYGEEMPLNASATESAWSMNRRAEFVVTWGGDGEVRSSTEQ